MTPTRSSSRLVLTATALAAVHHLADEADLAPMSLNRTRLAYDELLASQLALSLMRAHQRRSSGRARTGDGSVTAKILALDPERRRVSLSIKALKDMPAPAPGSGPRGRAAEEAAGHIRWLRPEYQAPGVQPGVQGKLLEEEPEAAPAAGPVGKHPWPDQLPAQAAALRDVLTALGHPADLSAIAVAFEGKATAKRKGDIERLLETMRVLGQVEVNERGEWG